MKFIKQTIALLLLSAGSLFAQEAIVASGGDISGTGGSVSYTVGQIAYTTISGANGSVSQGAQQPFEISVVLAVDDNLGIDLTMTAYPNPTIDNLNLRIGNLTNENLSYELYDVLGRVVTANKITNTSTNIEMSRLPVATYFLRIKSENKEIKVFRIIKN